MAEYIDREKLRQKMYQEAFVKDSDLQRWDSGCWIRYKLFENVLEKTEAADVQPVVHGHWIGTKEAEDMGDIMKEFTCSVCGCCEWDCTESESFNFCPNCGADMRGE